MKKFHVKHRNLPAWATAFGACPFCRAAVALASDSTVGGRMMPHPSHMRSRKCTEARARAAEQAKAVAS